MQPRIDNVVPLLREDPRNNLLLIQQSYTVLLDEYKRQESSIANIDDLYRKFKLLKMYEGST